MFEKIDDYTSRMKVPGGWLVRTIFNSYSGGASCHTIFISDPKHEWEINS